MDDKKEKKKPYGKTINKGDYPLFNNNAYTHIPPWKWAALGIAACGVVILIKVIVGSI